MYSASRQVKSAARPDTLQTGRLTLCRSVLHLSGTEGHRLYLPLPFDDPVGPFTFWSFDGPAQYGIFPTDFSSTMTAADFLLALAGVATDHLQGVVFFVSPFWDSCCGHDDRITPRR